MQTVILLHGNGTTDCLQRILVEFRKTVKVLQRETYRENRRNFSSKWTYRGTKTAEDRKMDRLRDGLKDRRQRKLNRDGETCTHKISRSKRFQKKYKKNANHRQRRKARKVKDLNRKMANVKNFSSEELNDSQKIALCLGKSFVFVAFSFG